MTGLLLCVAAAVITWFAARRNIVSGLVALLAVGYVYGIVRANVPQALTHFVFDGAVAGFYASVFRPGRNPLDRLRTAPLRPWMLLLIGWPLVLVLLPIQDPLVRLVGLRGAVFLLPFALIGARLTDADMVRVAIAVAILNILAFLVALAEFFIGVEPFFPQNAVTELIYRSRDVAGMTQHRIPSTFTSAHAYAATMAATSALLIGTWMQGVRRWNWLIGVAVVLSILGVFMAAARTHALIVGIVAIAATLSGSLRLTTRIAWLVPMAIIAFVVGQSERMQRFRTLQDADYVSERIQGSVNETFIEFATRYPMGVGLGGGGTSLPYFLQERVKDRVMMENEYARIMLETGLPGLVAWLAFIGWAFTRRAQRSVTTLPIVARLLWLVSALYFASAVTGTGLLTAVPLSVILMLYLGWMCARPVAVAVVPDQREAAGPRDLALAR